MGVALLRLAARLPSGGAVLSVASNQTRTMAGSAPSGALVASDAGRH